MSSNGKGSADYPALKDKTLAVVVDGSYSMNQQAQRVRDSLDWLNRQQLRYKLFICHYRCQTASGSGVADPFRYYGNAQVRQQLASWQSLTAQTAFDALVVLTDAGSYELDQQAVLEPSRLPPLWLVHLSGQQPYAYHDDLLQLIKGGQGGTATSLAAALSSYHTRLSYQQAEPRPFAITDHYLWYAEPLSEGGSSVAANKNFVRLAARQWIDFLSRNRNGNSLSQLDQFHALATRYAIVTDYSSMLVLVNERQQQALEQAEQGQDRFEREVETGAEDISPPLAVLSASAVPEPEEWILLGIVCLILLGRTGHLVRAGTAMARPAVSLPSLKMGVKRW